MHINPHKYSYLTRAIWESTTLDASLSLASTLLHETINKYAEALLMALDVKRAFI